MPLDILSPTDMPEDRPSEITLSAEMRQSFGAYAMSVIVSRALPDVRDGMKPVHRRIMYAMKKGGYVSTQKYRKSAKIVGEVMGNFHPHGDSAIYDSLVRMAQPFSLGEPLVDGQGNFGSVDGDPPAAMRYTESRLAKLADTGLVQNLDEDMVDMVPNYDGEDEEPRVLPARFCNLLVNGGTGIAVGMATNIPTHNLGEVIDLTLACMKNPELTVPEMMAVMPGPDFPTGGIIQGREGILRAYMTGRGSVRMNGVAEIEEKKGRQHIIITQLPYIVNKKELVEHIGELVNSKVIEGVSDVRDESDHRIRVVIDIRKDGDASLVLTALRKHTRLMDTFSVNMTCLNSRREPRVMGLAEVMAEFIAFRRDAVRRRTAFRMERARNQLERHIGLYAVRSRIDEVVALIRGSSDPASARQKLMELRFAPSGEFAQLLSEIDPDAEVTDTFHLSTDQANIVLGMELRSLTALQMDKIAEDARVLLKEITYLETILNGTEVLDGVISDEMAEIRDKFARPRRTVIEDGDAEDITEDDLIEDKQVVLTLTRTGYVKVTPLDNYREQIRGGKGRSGMDTKDSDVVVATRVCSLRTNLLFFTDRGIAHTLKAWKLPELAVNARGRHISNIIKGMRTGESIATMMPVPSEEGKRSMVFITDIGEVRRNNASDFARTNKGGKIAMKLEDDNGRAMARLIAVLDADESDDIVLCSRRGKCVRFPLDDLRVFGSRASTGVRGISLAAGDEVIGATVLKHSEASAEERQAYLAGGTAPVRSEEAEDGAAPLTLSAERMKEMESEEQKLLTVTSTGHGKRFSSHDLRVTARGAQGVSLGAFDRVPGELVACFPVRETDGIVLISDGGQIIRTRVDEIRTMGRTARGVRLFELPDSERIVDVSSVSVADTTE